MQQVLHLLIVDGDRRQALTAACGSRWLLPIVCCPERTRAGPLAARWLLERGIVGYPIGQWLGHLPSAGGTMDWIVVAAAHATPQSVSVQDLRWTPLTQLKSSVSVLDYQQWAVEKAVTRDLPSVDGPFGQMTWFDEILDWLQGIVGPPSGAPLFYTISSHDVVLRIPTASGLCYFKGLTRDRATEVSVTATLASTFPDSFARTLACERRADGSVWWLTAECAGDTLTKDVTVERLQRVAVALARIQQGFVDRFTDLCLPTADLTTVKRWASALIAKHASPETATACDEAMSRLERRLDSMELPRSWTPLDLDPGNVLIDRNSVRFIDLDDSHTGVAPLALSTFVRKVGGLEAESVRRAYGLSWMPRLVLGERWSDLDTASVLIDCYLGWQRMMQKIERAEVYGAIDRAAMSTARHVARSLGHGGTADAAQRRG